ncbi:glycosyltransferase [Noviherbaspirillum cavernae]|uniref:Glycosyltransferase n=1 Tax=Noviherbaspirillum cavernae TaxID=2320862 RepID=A0A418X6W3_9BURK|nr:glycosyltransferase [Noviherbaspirillum cavernae]
MRFDHAFLRERYIHAKGRYLHNNPDVLGALKRFAPEVVVTDGFYPTQLYAFGHAWMNRLAHVPFTDGTWLSEQALGKLHRAVRRFVFARSTAFLSASAGGQRLYESYGIAAERCFLSHLCIDNERYAAPSVENGRPFDFIFCGRMEDGKNPLFALEVAQATAQCLGRTVRILFVGSGSQDDTVKSAAQHAGMVDAQFHGFATQRELPALYRSARVFLFPTRADVWGVVANEACAAGLPVIVSPHAGVAGELVLDGQNGFVCALDASRWAERAALLLTHQGIWQGFSQRSRALVDGYTFDRAAAGFMAACRYTVPAGIPGRIKLPVSRYNE